ncbi:MAG: VOC family protein [Isosphaeraceae bacterium]
MANELPQIPAGSGKHPVALVVISTRDLARAGSFYGEVFGWQVQPMTPELAGLVAPGGPAAALRANVPDGFPGMVPYLSVPDVAAMLERVVSAGGAVERPPWNVPGVGTLARFRDPGGTIYGLMDGMAPENPSRMPMPLGSNPKPPEGSICHLEMYAADGAATARFFAELFGWGTLPTMPQYVGFDPGACAGGVFQSHSSSTPAMAYIYAADVAERLTRIEAHGGQRLGNPIRLPGTGTFGYFKDATGSSMGLIGR